MAGRIRIAFLAFIVGGSLPLAANAQGVIQLPTFQNFSMSTTVSVPDRGSVYAGGVGRSYRSSARRGLPLLPPSRRVSSAGTSASGVSVHAWIHDHEEMDRQVLNEWRRQRAHAPATRNAAALPATASLRGQTSGVVSNPSSHRLPRVSDVRRAVQAEKARKLAISRRYFDTAQRLEQKGKLSAARTVYRNALKNADEDLKVRVAEKLQSLELAIAALPSPKQR